MQETANAYRQCTDNSTIAIKLDKIQFEFPLKKTKYMHTIQTEKYIITVEIFARIIQLS